MKLLRTVVFCVSLVSIPASADTIYVKDITGSDGSQVPDVVNMLNNICGGAEVSVGADGKLAVGPGGNAVAAQLRDMCESPYVATLDVGLNLPGVFVGAFSPGIRTGEEARTVFSNGHQRIDVADLNVLHGDPDFGRLTKEAALFHEITEVFEAVRWHLPYWLAHLRAIDAENSVLATQGKTFVRTTDVLAPAPQPIPGGWRIRTPGLDGTLGPGWIVWDLKSRPIPGEPGGTTSLDWSYLGPESNLVDDLLFDEPDIYLADVYFVPEPATCVLLALGGLGLLRRRAW